MQHPYSQLRSEYRQLLATMRVTKPMQVDSAAKMLLQSANLAFYEQVATACDVPAALLAALDYRETSADPTLALGQGDRWDRVSVHVPRGHGPFASRAAAAEFYVRYDHLDDHSETWSWPYVCWKGEAWNGFGYRNHGIPTPYLWAGTNHQQLGMYVSDGQWDPRAVDRRIGIVPLMFRLCALRSEWKFDDKPTIDALQEVPAASQPSPLGVGGGPHDTKWVQTALNAHFLAPDAQLVVDGSYGRRTREAVRGFQQAHGLETDGLYGPKTDAALSTIVNEPHAVGASTGEIS